MRQMNILVFGNSYKPLSIFRFFRVDTIVNRFFPCILIWRQFNERFVGSFCWCALLEKPHNFSVWLFGFNIEYSIKRIKNEIITCNAMNNKDTARTKEKSLFASSFVWSSVTYRLLLFSIEFGSPFSLQLRQTSNYWVLYQETKLEFHTLKNQHKNKTVSR